MQNSEKIPTNLKYTKDHEWADTAGELVTIGITDHAQQSLGDIVFVELPAVGRTLKAHETFGVVESIKAVSDLYAPISGEIVETNAALTSSPEKINQSAYSEGWLIKIRPANKSELSELLDSSKYKTLVESL